MCLIAFSFNDHPKYKLVLMANRDEFYKRPTRTAQFWDDEGFPNILAGKDLKGKGTWMGVHKDGRWAALTNFRDPSSIKKEAPSRGELVINYLSEKRNATDYIRDIGDKASVYNGFNLLLGDALGVYHFSNQNYTLQEISPGIHGVSNALLDTPWPKLEEARKGLNNTIHKSSFQAEELFQLLLNNKKAHDQNLPQTGIPYKWEKAVSSIFIKTDNYGTRCSTILLIDHDNNIEFVERSYKPGNPKAFETVSFVINS